jgi:dTDP-4-amino-4,6-dideoxy-D-galactose acyltransferase
MNELPTTIQPLDWDSEFLGYPVARLATASLTSTELITAIDAAKHAGIKLLYCITDPNSSDLAIVLQQQGAWLADQKTTFVLSMSMLCIEDLPSAIYPATIWTPQLESLAWQSGEYSRFRLDPQFDTTVFRHLYSQWLHNSLSGKIASQVLVWHNEEGYELGLLTLGEKNQRADIGLLAVDETARGHSIGQCLMSAAKNWAISKGYDELQVVTQGQNLLACAFYTKCGFERTHTEHIYHLWLL